MRDVWVVDRVVSELATTAVKSFYPTYIAKRTGLPLRTAFQRLLQLANDGKLNLRWELRCNNYSCGRTIESFDSKTVFKDECECPFCGEVNSLDELYPVFDISTSYREYEESIKKNMINTRQLALC